MFQDCWSVIVIFARKPTTHAKPTAIVLPAPAWRTMPSHTLEGNVRACVILLWDSSFTDQKFYRITIVIFERLIDRLRSVEIDPLHRDYFT